MTKADTYPKWAADATIGAMAKQITTAERERDACRTVRAVREKELLDLKGPCSNKSCRLHHAHSGPCDVRDGHEHGEGVNQCSWCGTLPPAELGGDMTIEGF